MTFPSPRGLLWLADNLSPDRLGQLAEALTKARAALHAVTRDSWAEAWSRTENEYIERAIECAPEENEQRYMLLQAVKATRRARRVIEHEAQTIAGLETELALLTGEKKPAIV